MGSGFLGEGREGGEERDGSGSWRGFEEVRERGGGGFEEEEERGGVIGGGE